MNLIDFLVEAGPFGVFLIALVDGLGVPIPAGLDLLLATLAAKHPEDAPLLGGATTVGSLIGTMGLYCLARQGGETFLAKYTRDGRGRAVRLWFLEYGLITVFIPALVPVIPLPLKVPVICAGALGIRPMAFFLVVLAARIPRYGGLTYLGTQLAGGARSWVKANAWNFGLFAVALFLALYGFVLIAHRHKQGQEEA